MRKKTEKEREKVVEYLQNAATLLKARSGSLPLCASCKRIRDYKGCWKQIEINDKDHSEAKFNHGICPDCAEKLYPELYGKNRDAGKQQRND